MGEKNMSGFTHERLNPHLWRIVDRTGVCCYLVEGSQRACLLDTTNGLDDIRKEAESLTDKPVFVILTHAHLDHMGGSGLFDEVWMNPADMPVYRFKTSDEHRLYDARNRLHLDVEDVSQLPLIYEGSFHTLQDGQCFDLGGITVEMIAAPGHTPGTMCALLREERAIIFGDACGVAVMLMDEFSSCVSEYRESLLHLKEFEDQYDTIYRNHGTFHSPKELLNNVIECCELVLAGKDDHVPYSIYGHDLFICHQLAPGSTERADGRQGNLLYLAEKVR